MKKITAFLICAMLLLAPTRSAHAHENCPVEKAILEVVTFPFKVVVWVVTVPFKVGGELFHKHPEESKATLNQE